MERVALNLAERWQGDGHDVRVVLGRDEGLDRPRAPRALRYIRTRSAVPTASFETVWMMWCLFRYLAYNRVDVIFCPGNTYTVICVLMKLLFGDHCPPVVVKVSNDLVRRDKSRLAQLLYRIWLKVNGQMLEHFVALAEPMAAEIADEMKVERHRITVIHDPALDHDRLGRLLAIPRMRNAGRHRRFIAVGRLVPQKNITMLLLAFASGFKRGDRLTIVGAGYERTALQRTVRYLALQDSVEFVGHVPSPDGYLAEADCLLLSSNYEGVPAVVIEAIAAGLPVIATDCSSSMASCWVVAREVFSFRSATRMRCRPQLLGLKLCHFWARMPGTMPRDLPWNRHLASTLP